MRANEEDFDGFYAAVFARLVGQLTLVTGNLHEAEEVVQEALARAVPRWARLRAYDVPEAWVRRVALNLATSHHRRCHRSRRTRSRWPRRYGHCRCPTARCWSCTTCSACQSRRWPASWPSRWAPSRPGWCGAAAPWPAASPNPSRRCPTMDDLLDRLQELADGYAHQANPPGPAAARRRSRARRRATAVAVTGILVAGAAAVGLLWPPREPPTPPLQPPQS